MAISFAFLTPAHLTEHGGATSAIAYLARNIVRDPRFERPFDYTNLRDDLLHEEIILPLDCPISLLDREKLAIRLDEAEWRKVRTPLSQRTRRPQVGLALVVALPPSTEVSADEAAEIMRRIVLAARGSASAPIHIAIHEAQINRHGHALFALRSVDSDGVLGLKLRDFIVRLRHTASRNDGADVVEGIHWPHLTWETQQTFFHELGLDLVVDPIAPEPEMHFSPAVFRNGKIDDSKTAQRIASAREEAYADNVRAIEGSPTRLLEKLLRGRSSLRIAEIERLCAKFLDSETDQDANIARILTDQNIITLSDPGYDKKPRYVTTRRMHRLLTRATQLVDGPDEVQLKTFTGMNEASMLAQISEWYGAKESHERPLILGAKLSDCEVVKAELAAYAPIVGTIDMAVTGSQDRRAEGRERDVCLRVNRPIIVPHAELIDDRRLARLMIASRQIGTELVLGHDQSGRTGVVCRHLAAHAGDCASRESSPKLEDRDRNEVVRFLRAGLVRHAVEEIANTDSLEFGNLPDTAEDASLFVVCDDPHRIGDLSRRIRRERAMSGTFGEPMPLIVRGKEAEFSVGEWIAVSADVNSKSDKFEFARIVAIDAANGTVDVAMSGESKRIDLKRGAVLRPASVLSIREARSLFADATLAIEATDPRRVWSALLLVAARGQSARLHVDPKLARTKADLIDVARRSLPGALPHQRTVRGDPDAAVGMIMSTISDQFEVLPHTTPVETKPPRPINATPEVRRLVAYDSGARDGYKLLYDYVGPYNPDHIENATRALGLYRNELTRTVIRFLAGIERNCRRDPHAPLDLPRELEELEPERWTYLEVDWLRTDLRSLTIPGLNCPIKSSLAKPTRSLPSQRNATIGDVSRERPSAKKGER
ncbi:MobA/MobL family protein [Bradyrhizobium liaoningense]|uniref:MobA/MobL family protein n=1 Tax=Bradyrhizobium liaoningense TaxID=43992 RepID=UPI001BA99166|nr:MobA/MobL family protein [Bradyrhizobium liaoningense]MBR0858269.1 MobA/MobL family protein [Bradyrhizobium liaoningense]